MKIIFSNLNMSRFKDFDDETLKVTNEMAKLSNFLVQEYGYKTCFYGDKYSLNFFSNINYSEFNELNDERVNEIPQKIWSIGKLFSMLKPNEPFIHLDYDIFLFKNFDKDFLNKDLVYYHKELYRDSKLDEYQSFFELIPVKTRSFINRSYNCGLIGGKNFKILQKICEEILSFIIDNKKEINIKLNSAENLNFPKYMPSVLIEQVWIFQLLKYYKQVTTPYLLNTDLELIAKESYLKNLCHIQGGQSKKLVIKNILSINKYLGI